MANILLRRTVDDDSPSWHVEEWFYNPSTKKAFHQERYGVSPNPGNFSRNISERIDQYCSGPDLIAIRHDGNGGIHETITYDAATCNAFTATVFNKSNVSTYGGSDGHISVATSGGTAPFTYAWDGENNYTSTQKDITGLKAGYYTLTVTDSKGKKAYLRVQITQPASTLLVVFTSVTNVKCHGDNSGAIDLSITGGTTPYDIHWSRKSDNWFNNAADLNFLTADTYTVTVTDAAGAVKKISTQVTQPDPIALSTQIDGEKVTLLFSGGKAPYFIQWEDGFVGATRLGVQPGDYSVSVRDANQCIKNFTVTVGEFKFHFTGNPILLDVEAENYQSKPNLSFLCEVWIEPVYLSNQFVKLMTLEQPAYQGKTTFDVQAIIENDSNLDSALPNYRQNSMTLAGNMFKRFYLRSSEKYGDTPVAQPFQKQITQYAILGGISRRAFAEGKFFSEFVGKQMPFWDWQPIEKEVFEDQPEYLYFLVPRFGMEYFKVCVQIFYDDDTNYIFYPFQQYFAKRYEIFCIPAGYNQLDIADRQAGKTVLRYAIEVIDENGTAVSERRVYHINRDYYPEKKYFLFRSSLGGMATFAAYALSEHEAGLDSESVERYLPARSTESPIETVYKQIQPNVQTGTRYLNAEENSRAQDFLLSRDVYLEKNNQYVPVVISARNATLEDEESTLHQLAFSYQEEPYEFFTPKLVITTGKKFPYFTVSPYITNVGPTSATINFAGAVDGLYYVLVVRGQVQPGDVTVAEVLNGQSLYYDTYYATGGEMLADQEVSDNLLNLVTGQFFTALVVLQDQGSPPAQSPEPQYASFTTILVDDGEPPYVVKMDPPINSTTSDFVITISLEFNEPIRKTNGENIPAGNLINENLIQVREDNAGGAIVPIEVVNIDAQKRKLIARLADFLDNQQTYWVGHVSVEDFNGNESGAQSYTFTTGVSLDPYLGELFVMQDFEQHIIRVNVPTAQINNFPDPGFVHLYESGDSNGYYQILSKTVTDLGGGIHQVDIKLVGDLDPASPPYKVQIYEGNNPYDFRAPRYHTFNFPGTPKIVTSNTTADLILAIDEPGKVFWHLSEGSQIHSIGIIRLGAFAIRYGNVTVNNPRTQITINLGALIGGQRYSVNFFAEDDEATPNVPQFAKTLEFTMPGSGGDTDRVVDITFDETFY